MSRGAFLVLTASATAWSVGSDASAGDPDPVRLDPEMVTFPTVPPGAREEMDVAVVNDSDDAVEIIGTAVSGEAFFLPGNECAGPLEGGGRCSVRIGFAPLVENATFSGQLTVDFDSLGGPGQVAAELPGDSTGASRTTAHRSTLHRSTGQHLPTVHRRAGLDRRGRERQRHRRGARRVRATGRTGGGPLPVRTGDARR
jgi:hypothetical protein